MAADRVIEPSDAVVSTPVGDDVVVVSLNDGRYFGLRGSATRIWELILERTHEPDEIVAVLLREFDVGEAALRRDVEAALSGLEARGLIRLVPRTP